MLTPGARARPPGARFRTALWITFSLLLLILGAYLVSQWWPGGVPDRNAAAQICMTRYARARMRVDTLAIDLQRPITPGVAPNRALSCGQMRRRGLLK